MPRLVSITQDLDYGCEVNFKPSLLKSKILNTVLICFKLHTLWFQLEDMFQLIATPQDIEKVTFQLIDTPTKIYAIGVS